MSFPTYRAKLALAAWLETQSEFRLSPHADNLMTALEELDSVPSPVSYGSQLKTLKRSFNRLVFGLLMLAFLLGLLAVPSAFATTVSNQVNIFWLLLVLLGFHALNFTLWAITLMASVMRASNSQGVLLSLLLYANTKVSQYAKVNGTVCAAYLRWQCPAQANKWLLSGLSHGAWGGYLLAGWFMTWLLLLTNQVNFVWETTLLSDAAFVQLTQTLNVVPQWFGVAVPNSFDILASRVDQASQASDTRQHWANLLLASIFFYGVLPRLFFALLCTGLYLVKRAAQPLSTQEKIIQNRYRRPEYQQKMMVDADHAHLTTAPLSDNQDTQLTLPNDAFSHPWALFEWSTEKPLFLASVCDVMSLNSREQQDQLLATPTDSPVYIAVDATQSPDRGSRRFFTRVRALYSSVYMVIVEGEHARFTDDWQRLAREADVPSITHIVKE
ncbi:DUF2868 domain-containing protein [Marinomonas sp. IMCC 4694]|uniref:DUF2868 domain-containing protein n=1 Tax=Marinomonas sp. IMCC 4694 TaxID=2605432 RepID=UPI0011E85A84|nr:DUF2868 domain-containing protein [Marinomonas sp. IMCC 4694]TYL46715.1 DUF2868 domain-containing protein [Marinomonas sp. IMCC 4694]